MLNKRWAAGYPCVVPVTMKCDWPNSLHLGSKVTQSNRNWNGHRHWGANVGELHILGFTSFTDIQIVCHIHFYVWLYLIPWNSTSAHILKWTFPDRAPAKIHLGALTQLQYPFQWDFSDFKDSVTHLTTERARLLRLVIYNFELSV